MIRNLPSSRLRSDPHRKVTTCVCFCCCVDQQRRDAGSDWQGQRSQGVRRWLGRKWESPPLSRTASLFYRGLFRGTVFLNFSCCRFLIWRSVFVSLCRLPLFLSLLLLRLHPSPVVWQFSALHSSVVCVCVYIRRELLAPVFPGVCVCVWGRDVEFFIRNLLKLCACVYLNVHAHFWHSYGWWMWLYIFSLYCCHGGLIYCAQLTFSNL